MGADERRVTRSLAKQIVEKLQTKKRLQRTSGVSACSIVNDVQENNDSSLKKKRTKDSLTNVSILPHLYEMSHGKLTSSKFRNLNKTCIINQASRFQFSHTFIPFQRRVTSIAWHPVFSDVAVAASKGGELSWFKLNTVGYYANEQHIPGIGPGGSIVGVKFKEGDPCIVYTASMTGYVKEFDFDYKTDKILLTVTSAADWFSSLDVCYERKLIMAGDTHGFASLITEDGIKVWTPRKRLHRTKVTHVEFSAADPNIFVTASTDHTVKLWDFRMLHEGTDKPVSTFPFKRAVNSATFSSNGHSLLTTDQHSEIKVYKSPGWHEEFVISHPHRQFQHLSPIKATWHPVEDIFIVGRYPDDNFLLQDERTLDFYDGSSGELLLRKKGPDLIPALNAYNVTADTILTAAGKCVAFWKAEYVCELSKFVH